MLVVETVAKIRRAFFVHGKAIKEICREFRLSRKVVRKVIRSDETAFTYQRSIRGIAETFFRPPPQTARSQLGEQIRAESVA